MSRRNRCRSRNVIICSRDIFSDTLSQPVEPRLPPAAGAHADWLLWQWADSAFPTGGFAHSAGLESAWRQGAVCTEADLASFLEANLQQVGHAALPLATAAHSEPQRLAELDRLCDAFTTNHVANRASRAQGRALLATAARVFQRPPGSAPFGHWAPAFGAVARWLHIPRDTAQRLFFFQHLRGVLAAAVRLNVVGPLHAQALQHRLAPRLEEILTRCSNLTPADLTQTAPLLDIWQAMHDRLYSRLFQS